MQMDHDFHNLIVRSTGNSYLIEFVGRLYDQISRIRFLTLKTHSERYSEIQHEHLRIIDCLLRRDADGASAAMADHLARAHATAVNTFQKATLV
ncbi:MAG: FadR family transcriptional regulator [Spirochaetaceae bacterium]|nr:MAG: FadR family transcriptional regulator [Spirochaetaceae bacterium]